MGCVGEPGLGIFGCDVLAIFGHGEGIVCATRKEFQTAFDSQSIATEGPHGTMFRENLSGDLKF
jgi:hypothetical protein